MKTLCAFEVFVAEKKAQGVSPRTLEAYSYAAKPLIAMSPRLPCKPVILQKYIYDNNWSQEKREFVYRHVRAFMTWFCKREELPNPMGSILRPRVPKKDVKYLSRDQLRLMDVWLRNDRDKAIVYLLLDTGMRTGELVSLKFEDIRDDDVVVRGKTGERTVLISPQTKHLLLSLPLHKDGYVFHALNRGKKGGHLGEKGVYQMIQKYMKLVAFTGKQGAHTFRHTFAVHSILLGNDIISVRDQMGHASITTTEQYLHLAREDRAQQHRAHTPLQIIADPVANMEGE